MKSLLAVCLLASIVHIGCSSGSSSPDDKGSMYGNVVVDLKGLEGYTDFSANFRDGPFPPPSDTGARGPSMTKGDCQLLVPVGCEPACDANSWCTGKNQCTPKSATVDEGTLHVQGLDNRDLVLASSGGNYAVTPTLPLPACNEGSAVTVMATDFSLAGKCIAVLNVTSTAPISVMAGHAVDLAWTAPAQSSASRVQITVEISHHGGYAGQIDCDVADTGSFSIPESLVTSLYNLGRHGFPTVTLTRVSTASAPTQTHVKLLVASTVPLEADTGVISCNGDDECTAPKTCQTDRTCQ